MKYFKIYKQCAKVSKAFYELSESEFNVEIGDYAADHSSYDCEEDGDIDYGKLEDSLDEAEQDAIREAKDDYGLDCGDYRLYIRDDDVELLDMTRPNN